MVTIVIWGIGNMAIDRLLRYSWDEYAVVLVDNNVNKRRGKRILNYAIIEPEKLANMEFDYLIVGAGPRYKSEIRKEAVTYCDEKQILDLDDFVKRLPINLGEKYVGELAYWVGRKIAETSFNNSHYKSLFLSIAEEQDDCFIENKIIADFGCGPRGSLAWADKAATRVGIDVLADKYVDIFHEDISTHGMWYVKSTENCIPMPDSSVDIVSTINSMDHVHNFQQMFSEITRILKNGGVFLASFNLNEPVTVCEPQTFRYDTMMHRLRESYDNISVRIAYKDNENTYQNFYAGRLIERPDSDKPAIMWVRANKKDMKK